MGTLVIQSTDEGIRLDADSLKQAGIEPGMVLEVRQLADREKIQNAALAYVCWKLGDALRVGEPEWSGTDWRVPIFAPLQDLQIGVLAVDPLGQVIPADAPTPNELTEAYDAARAATQAA